MAAYGSQQVFIGAAKISAEIYFAVLKAKELSLTAKNANTA